MMSREKKDRALGGPDCSQRVFGNSTEQKVVITLRRDNSDAHTRPDLLQSATSSAHHAERDGD